jgi:DNA mismatch repair protein MutS
MTQTDPDGVEAEPALAPVGASESDRFQSLLFRGRVEPRAGQPGFFTDLNLDQVVDAIVGRRDDYDLEAFFWTPLADTETAGYRHEVFRDLEAPALRVAIDKFAAGMRKVRGYLALVEKQSYTLEKQRWLLDAAATYCQLVQRLADALAVCELGSRGMRGLRDYLAAYSSSRRFSVLEAEARAVLEGLSQVRYTLRIKGGRVTVQTYLGERDYSAEAEQTFARFRGAAAQDHLVKVPDSGSMDHVEAQIAQFVSRLYPGEFTALAAFCTHHGDFVDPVVTRSDRELQFYLAYTDYIEPLRAAGLPFSYPVLVHEWSETAVLDAYDIALAAKTGSAGAGIVPNDFTLSGAERILVVTGPNQGGKTTFARMIGQLHYLAALGVPVPARDARVVLTDQLFTRFGRPEDIATLRGRLDEELVQVKAILEQATGFSMILLNEVLASTTLGDAASIGVDVVRRITDVGCAAVWVTFVDELADGGAETVSMVACVAPDDPARRTYKITRKPADGRAYARAIAERYGLSYQRLTRRIRR